MDESALHTERYADMEAAEKQELHCSGWPFWYNVPSGLASYAAMQLHAWLESPGDACCYKGEDGSDGEEDEPASRREQAGRSAGGRYSEVGPSYGRPDEPEEAPGELYVPRFEVPPDLARLLHGVTETGHKVGASHAGCMTCGTLSPVPTAHSMHNAQVHLHGCCHLCV